VDKEDLKFHKADMKKLSIKLNSNEIPFAHNTSMKGVKCLYTSPSIEVAHKPITTNLKTMFEFDEVRKGKDIKNSMRVQKKS
jgi:hypothetical protein